MDARLVAYLASLGADPASLDAWVFNTVQRDGEDVGFVAVCGPEIHVYLFAERKAISRRNLLEHLQPIIDTFGYATTRVPLTETNHRLRTALGFVHTWDDESYSYWCLTRLRYARTQKGEPSCQS